MERKTAEGFLQYKIHDQYCWPFQNEPIEAEKIRKNLNQKLLRSEKAKQQRRNETTEERFTRLKTMKDNVNHRRREETEESRNHRLELQRESDTRRRSEETEESRNHRLEVQRDYNHFYNYQKQFSCEVCGKALSEKIVMNIHGKKCM